MGIGNKISELRKSANLSQEQLAEKLNVTRQTISNWELGQTVPDIVQAEAISKIFKITLDELTDNNVKDILVEKISNTEKMASTTIKTLKFLSITVIAFLIILILMNIMLIAKSKTDKLNIKSQELAYQKYMDNIKTKRFYININDEKYSYIIQYGKDYIPIGDTFTLISGSNDKTDENYETYLNYIWKSYKEHSDVREQIKDLKYYFENKGGTWEESKD